jgi:hypothetical protein
MGPMLSKRFRQKFKWLEELRRLNDKMTPAAAQQPPSDDALESPASMPSISSSLWGSISGGARGLVERGVEQGTR